jgi:hypothetical protein
VRIQELWAADRPLFALANLGSAPVAISVHERASGRLRAGPWRLEPGAVAAIEAGAIQGAGLVEFRLGDGRSLGLLDAPPAGGSGVPASSGVVVTTDGLNGSGGRHGDVWLEQPAERLSGGEIALTLKVKAAARGTIWFERKRNPPLTGSSDSLPVAITPDRLTIDLGRPRSRPTVHEVRLRLQAPRADRPGLLVLEGWFARGERGGHTLVRGLIIEPSGHTSPAPGSEKRRQPKS